VTFLLSSSLRQLREFCLLKSFLQDFDPRYDIPRAPAHGILTTDVTIIVALIFFKGYLRVT